MMVFRRARRASLREILMVTLVLLAPALASAEATAPTSPLSIHLWYGTEQRFGQLGNTQRWINVLGNISAEESITETSYQLNDQATVGFSVGSDLHRLAGDGDFNIDLDRSLLREGANQLVITARDETGRSTEANVTLLYESGHTWPLPFSIDWSEVDRLQDVAEVIDGHWEITPGGLSNRDNYYDRVVGFGDDSWSNYEVVTTVTFHDFTPPSDGPPTYNVSHAAIATRWPGHDVDELQPHRKWFPLGATAEFRLTDDLAGCRWRIFDGPKPNDPDFYVEQPEAEYRTIELNRIYGMKHRVQSLPDGATRYQVKLWPADEAEPGQWDLVGIEQAENVSSGSALLLAHNTRVTFGDVRVTPLHAAD